MNSADKIPVTDQSLLRAAQTAIERGDLQRADTLFIEHLAHARSDATGLADYGNFCLRTGRPDNACYLLYKANRLRPGDDELLNELGYAWMEAGIFDDAKRNFETLLARDPRHAGANYGLASCHQHAGDWSAAATAFARALVAQPGTLPIVLQLAEACDRSGDSQRARVHYELAERLAPNDPAMLLAHARFLRRHGDAAKALHRVEVCARPYPDNAEIVLEKARCLRTLGDRAQALHALTKLEQKNPGLPECHEEFGNCLQKASESAERELHWISAIDLWIKAGESDSADQLLERLLAEYPGSAIGWNLLGILRDAQQRIPEAESAYRAAIEADRNWLDAYANLATLYERTNRIEDGQRVVESALAIQSAPDGMQRAAVELRLAACKIARRRKDYPEALNLLDRIAAMEPSDIQRQMAAFERGKLFDLLDDPGRAIDAFVEGNALASAHWLGTNGGTGSNKFLAGVEHMLTLAGQGELRRWRPIADLDDSRDPVFLIGFPRSGTTLLNQVLDSHSALQTIEEEQTIGKVLGAVRHMPADYPGALADCDAHDISYLRKTYYRAASGFCTLDPAKRLVDKFPLHTTLAGLIHRVFPNARFLFAVRHPCDVVLSCFMQNFQFNDAMANFYNLADTVALYTRTMDLWQAYREQLHLLVHTVRYEDVVDDFDGQVRALCDFIEVPWEEELRRFASNALDRGKIKTVSYEQVSKPIYREGRYRWERYRESLVPHLPALRPYIERFGYADPAQPIGPS